MYSPSESSAGIESDVDGTLAGDDDRARGILDAARADCVRTSEVVG